MNKYDRLKIFIRHLIAVKIAKSQKDLGVMLGYNNESYFSQIINGKANEPTDFMRKLKSLEPLLNIEWIEYGIGEMLKSAPTVQQNNVHGNNNYNTGVVRIGSVPVEYAEVECPKCGEVIDVTNTAIIPLIPPEVVRKPDLDIEHWRHNYPQQMEEVDLRQVWGKGVFLMKVDTRAMEPEYREGSYLVLRKLPDISYARADGSAYVVDTMRPHALFRYLSKERDGMYVLSAESDKRGPIYLKEDDILNVYDVVGCFRIGR